MVKSLSDKRIGVYECDINGDWVKKGKSIKKYYYGLFYLGLVDSMILPDFRELKRAGEDFEFPVLIVTWYLGEGNPPKLLPKPSGRLSIKRAGGLRNFKRMIGMPTQRKKKPLTETWEVVIDERGQVFEVEGTRIRKP